MFAKSFPDICKKVWDCTKASWSLCDLIADERASPRQSLRMIKLSRQNNCFSPVVTYLHVSVQIHQLALWKNLIIPKYEFRKGNFILTQRSLDQLQMIKKIIWGEGAWFCSSKLHECFWVWKITPLQVRKMPLKKVVVAFSSLSVWALPQI